MLQSSSWPVAIALCWIIHHVHLRSLTTGRSKAQNVLRGPAVTRTTHVLSCRFFMHLPPVCKVLTLTPAESRFCSSQDDSSQGAGLEEVDSVYLVRPQMSGSAPSRLLQDTSESASLTFESRITANVQLLPSRYMDRRSMATSNGAARAVLSVWQ